MKWIYISLISLLEVKGVSLKTWPFHFLLFQHILFNSLATNMLESWDLYHSKGEIHSSVWSTKTFLYDIREPRKKKIKMGYHISKFLNIGQSSFLKSDVPYCYIVTSRRSNHIWSPLPYFQAVKVKCMRHGSCNTHAWPLAAKQSLLYRYSL